VTVAQILLPEYAATLAPYYQGPVHSIGNAVVAPSPITATRVAGQQRIIYLARLVPGKQQDLLIRAAVNRHAFQREKERFVLLGETAKADFLRQGRLGEWREWLTPSQQALFRQRLAGLLRQLNYAEGGEKA
jgi:hypothetical protein